MGVETPDTLSNAPELRQGLQLYLEAFFDLDSERNHAMGLARIPWSSIRQYAEAFEFDEEQTDELFFFIRRMDTEHLKRLEAKSKKGKGNGSNIKRPSRAPRPYRR